MPEITPAPRPRRPLLRRVLLWCFLSGATMVLVLAAVAWWLWSNRVEHINRLLDSAGPVRGTVADLALTTDGFFEWPNVDGVMFGTHSLRRSLARHANRGSGSIIDGLVRDVEAFAGIAPQPDDLTAVIIKRLG